ncbi:MAG: type II secretion system protein GspM [Thermodesulfovibrionales bacterium]|nr:type II secretion system protein GspM [Thermodesulfovibrionales bacterium]
MRRSKFLKISIPLIIILFTIVFYQHGYLYLEEEFSTAQESLNLKIKTLQKYNQLIAEKPDLEKMIATLKESKRTEETKLIEGQTLSLSAATLQDMVKGIIISRGGTISSERVGKAEDLGNYKVISISIDTVIPDIRALMEIIYEIESHIPYLVIKELDIRGRNFREPRELMVKLDVIALTGAKTS